MGLYPVIYSIGDKSLLSPYLMATPFQDVFGRDMVFNLASVIDWQVVTATKQRQVDIGNVQEKSRLVTHGYAIGD